MLDRDGREGPALAVSMDGEVVDLPPEIALRLMDELPDVAREWRRWRARHGASGRVILIDRASAARAMGHMKQV